MISSLTEEGAEATLEAIEPVPRFCRQASRRNFAGDRPLEPDPVSRRFGQRGQYPDSRSATAGPSSSSIRARRGGIKRRRSPAKPAGASSPEPGLVLIGTSTGGPAALDIVLPQLPADFPWPVLVAQHLPASFTGAFAKAA